MTYNEYINSPEWENLRERKFLQVGRQCEACQWNRPPLECHHLEYRNLIDCNPSDLLVLCKRCHNRLHDWLSIRRRQPSDYNRDQTINIILYGCANRQDAKPKETRKERRQRRKREMRALRTSKKFRRENKQIDMIKQRIIQRAELENRVVSLILCHDATD